MPAEASFHVYKHSLPVGGGFSLTLSQVTSDGSATQAGVTVTTDDAGVVTVPPPATASGIARMCPHSPRRKFPLLPMVVSAHSSIHKCMCACFLLTKR